MKAGEVYEIQPLIGELNIMKKMVELVKKTENELLAFFPVKAL